MSERRDETPPARSAEQERTFPDTRYRTAGRQKTLLDTGVGSAIQRDRFLGVTEVVQTPREVDEEALRAMTSERIYDESDLH